MAKQDSHSNKAYDYLLALLTQTNDKAHLSEILKALLTEKEQAELGNRLTIFALLQQEVTQREIRYRHSIARRQSISSTSNR
ncbi:Trp family transcriptional regulator [Psychrobacter sp. HII-4]|uniref:Trp family transcriptional regulator n=1 Tax=Psychrobacter sp. HII-4 TaxID=1569264 RepID=UPI002A0A732D|nr:Trp family transcriptional regulator [Psychrobacter sp. HII-4]